MSIQAEDLSGYIPSFGWEMARPTDKQKNTLEKLGIFPDEIEHAGKAAKLLDRLAKRRETGLTTPKQIRFLESRGFQPVSYTHLAANPRRRPKGGQAFERRRQRKSSENSGSGRLEHHLDRCKNAM